MVSSARAAASGQYVLGVDGGQSSTACLVGRMDGAVLGLGLGGPIRHIGERGGAARNRQSLDRAVRKALAQARVPPGSAAVRSAYLSITGNGEGAADVVRDLVPAAEVAVGHDSVGALASGRYGEPGVVLIAGTGTCAAALGPAGQWVLMGGWGSTLGDEGGGYWIGLSALRAAIRASEGRGPETVLRTSLMEELALAELRPLFDLVYSQQLDRTAIAGLAPVVMRAARQGDGVAAAIVDQAADELYRLAWVTAEAATFLSPQDRVIVCTGGVLRFGDAVWDRLAGKAQDRPSGCELVRADLPQVAGAYLLALRASGVSTGEQVVDRVRASLSETAGGGARI